MKRTPTSTIKATTPIRSMRAFCLDCTGGDRATVRECSFTDCPLFPYRMGRRPPKGTAATPMKTIRKQCLECCSGSFAVVRACPAESCPLYRYRLGHKPLATDGLGAVGVFSDAPVMNHTPKESRGQKAPLFDGVL